MSSRTARLGREVIGYVLGAPAPLTSDKGAPSHAALVGLSNPNASSPLATLRGTTPLPSSSSFNVASTSDGSSSIIVHADRSRPLIHVHTYHSSSQSAASSSATCTLAARLHPPEATHALAISPRGTMLAAGAQSGKLYVWHLPSGRLLASVDAHFRALSCLQWTACEQGLVSASEDGRILVWSMEALLSSTGGASSALGNSLAMPYAILADHVQGVSAIALSSSSSAAISSFPSSLRILSSSADGTVKLWDVRTRSLVATWAFAGPVKHLAVDVGFRSFFAVVQARTVAKEVDEQADHQTQDDDEKDATTQQQQQYDWIHQVFLFDEGRNGNAVSSSSAAGASATSLMRVSTSPATTMYQADAGVRITALTISLSGSHLLVGRSDAHLVTIDVASSVAIRTTSLVAAGQLGGVGTAKSGGIGANTPHVEILALKTFLIEDRSSVLQGASVHGKRAGWRHGHGSESAWTIAEKLDRTLYDINAASTKSRHDTFPVRLEKQNVYDILQLITPPSLAVAPAQRQGDTGHISSPTSNAAGPELVKARERVAELERDNEKLNDLLKRAQKTNAGLWERIVQDATSSNTGNTMNVE